MSRQKGSFGQARELEMFQRTIKQSLTAGANKYARVFGQPQQGARERARRLQQQQRQTVSKGV